MSLNKSTISSFNNEIKNELKVDNKDSKINQTNILLPKNINNNISLNEEKNNNKKEEKKDNSSSSGDYEDADDSNIKESLGYKNSIKKINSNDNNINLSENNENKKEEIKKFIPNVFTIEDESESEKEENNILMKVKN